MGYPTRGPGICWTVPNPEVSSWFPEKGKVQLVRNVGKEEIGKEEKVSKENLGIVNLSQI